MTFDRTWAEEVAAVCDPVFESADVGFRRQIALDPRRPVVQALLWEADPLLFARRYPDSGIVESYGEQWPPPCIDFWVHVDAARQQATLDVEGRQQNRQVHDLTGDGHHDGVALGTAMAAILDVPAPRP